MRMRYVLLLFCLAAGVVRPPICLAESIPVVASVFPVADMVRQVGGRHVSVTVAIPAGASPHTFEPKPSLVKKISKARIYFMIGAGLETWSAKFISAFDRPPLSVVLSEGVSLIRELAHQERHGHGHDTGAYQYKPGKNSFSATAAANPHIWLDPVIAADMTRKVMSALTRIDAVHRDVYEKNGRKFIAKIEALHQLIAATVGGFSIKEYIAFHPAWDYFARRYGLVAAGVIETAPGRDPTPQRVKKIIADIKRYRIQAVFAEPQLNPKVAHVIAREAGVRVLLLDPIGGDGIKGRDTYLNLMNYNLGVLAEAMR